jgi:hypothetical protein
MSPRGDVGGRRGVANGAEDPEAQWGHDALDHVQDRLPLRTDGSALSIRGQRSISVDDHSQKTPGASASGDGVESRRGLAPPHPSLPAAG